ncbi:MAG: hypothetical protein ACX94A_14620, partial [Algiphilus sp.]
MAIAAESTTVGDAKTPAAATSETTAADVMACMRANVPQQLRLRELIVRTEETDGDVRTLRARMY